jgi:hypothetical protein
VHDAAALPLLAWQSFYVIVGSASAALIGLQFVVIALLAGQKGRATAREIDAFATPTIRHFGASLLVSSMLCAPWPSLAAAGTALAICGATGVVYVVVIIYRARYQTAYQLVFEDWLWYMALPLLAYASLGVAAFALARDTSISLFATAGTTLLLLFIGIHNAWDTITYIVLQAREAGAPAAGIAEASSATLQAPSGRHPDQQKG